MTGTPQSEGGQRDEEKSEKCWQAGRKGEERERESGKGTSHTGRPNECSNPAHFFFFFLLSPIQKARNNKGQRQNAAAGKTDSVSAVRRGWHYARRQTDRCMRQRDKSEGGMEREQMRCRRTTVTKKEGLFQVVPGSIRSIHFLCWQSELAHFRGLDIKLLTGSGVWRLLNHPDWRVILKIRAWSPHH